MSNWRHRIGPWIPLLFLLPFLILTPLTIFQRFAVPYELEWNEGHSGELAWRVAQGLPLYPSPETGWVPYMYAPLYHMTLGWVFKLTGDYTLAWGRLLSLLATLSTVMAIFAIVHDRTKHLAASCLAVLVYLAYFKACGFSYDLARVDSFAFGFMAIGLYCCLKRFPSPLQIIIGLCALALASLAKQNIAPLALYCGLVALYRRPRTTIPCAALLVILVANFLFVYQATGNSHFLKYTVTNALRHPSRSDIAYPNNKTESQFREALGENAGLVTFVQQYVKQSIETTPPALWLELGQHCWLFVLFILSGLLAVLFRRRNLSIYLYVPVAVILVWMGISAYAKYGGFINNFQPIFLGIALMAGLVYPSILRIFGSSFQTIIVIYCALIFGAQIYQPWNIPSTGNSRTNYQIVQSEPGNSRRKRLEEYRQYLERVALSKEQGVEISEKSDARFSTRWRYHYSRIAMAGLLWRPASQWPAEGTRKAWTALRRWLSEAAERDESALVIHHQWYGLTSGHDIGPNLDMIRCANWAGDPVPDVVFDVFTTGHWQWLILDMESLDWEWLPYGIANTIRQNYEYVGVVPGMEFALKGRALMPVTGAEMRPLYLWKYRGVSTGN